MPLSHGFYIILSRAKQCSVYVAGSRWCLPGEGSTYNPSDEPVVRTDRLSAETDCNPRCGIWSSLISKLSQYCISRGETTDSQLDMPLGWRLPRSAGCIKYIMICDIFTLRRASVEHLHCGMWCASSDRLGPLYLQLLSSKSAAFLSPVTIEHSVSVRSCGGGSTWCPL